jgi:hypothetical protein
MTITELQDALVYTNIIDRDAIEDPDGYDEGSTLAQIDELHKMLPDDTTLLRQALESLRGYRREHGHTQPCDAEIALCERLGVKE